MRQILLDAVQMMRRSCELVILSLLLSASTIVCASEQTSVLVVGDSLSAAYGFARPQGWVNLMRRRLGPEYKVVNASISGDTTAGGLARLPRLLERESPQILIIELGANDGLQGMPPAVTRANLEKMIDLAQAAGAACLLVPVRLPPNYGEHYIQQHLAAFEGFENAPNLALSDYLMRGVAEDLDMMQADGLHPLPAAQARLLDNVWPALSRLLERPDPDTVAEAKR